MLQKIGIILYRMLENIDGEKGKRFCPYCIAERLKIWILNNMILKKGE
jgi:hypothetical protein